MSAEKILSVIDLNVGGVVYATTLSTLTKYPTSLLGHMFEKALDHPPDTENNVVDPADTSLSAVADSAATPALVPDSKGRYFIDRDGVLFRYVLDFLRTGKLILPENFHERERLRSEADYFRLEAMTSILLQLSTGNAASLQRGLQTPPASSVSNNAYGSERGGGRLAVTGDSNSEDGYITVGYRGTFAYGRDGVADVKFRKMNRILVCGRVSLCRAAFGDTLNESRDPDRGPASRYTSRFFLKHLSLEHAFDTLQISGFRLVTSCASGTSTSSECKTGMDSEENKWYHYNEFVFCRP